MSLMNWVECSSVSFWPSRALFTTVHNKTAEIAISNQKSTFFTVEFTWKAPEFETGSCLHQLPRLLTTILDALARPFDWQKSPSPYSTFSTAKRRVAAQMT